MSEKIGYKDLLPPKEFSEKPVSKQDQELMAKHGGRSVDSDKAEEKINLTLLDEFSISPEFNEEELIAMTEKILGDRRVEKRLPQLSERLIEARSFLTQYLRWSLPREMMNFSRLNTVEDLIGILHKTKTLKKGGEQGYSPFYCAWISTAIAEIDYNKRNFQGFVKECDYLANKLFQSYGERNEKFFHHKKDLSEEWELVAVSGLDMNYMELPFSYRGKGHDSTIGKLLIKPELGTEQIVQDGIGLRFELNMAKPQQAGRLVSFIAEFFKDKMGAKKISFQNRGMFENKQMIQIKKELTTRLRGISCEIRENPKANPFSNSEFKSADLKITLKMPAEGDESLMTTTRTIEVRFIPDRFKVEERFNSHKVYKATQKLSATTRLLGVFPEAYLDLICKECEEDMRESDGGQLNADEIKRHLFDNHIVAEVKTRGNKKKYCTTDHLIRWARAGKLPDGLKFDKGLSEEKR